MEVGTEKTMNIKNFCSDKCLASYQGISQVTIVWGLRTACNVFFVFLFFEGEMWMW